jgi:hypothetical protein
MKRDQRAERAKRMHQDFAQLQCIESEGLKSDTDLKCTLTHQIQPGLGDSTACSINLVGGWKGNILRVAIMRGVSPSLFG